MIADQKEKFAKEQPYYPDAPKELVSISELIQQQQAILAKNGENARKRQNVTVIQQNYDFKKAEVEDFKQKLKQAEAQLAQLENDLSIAQTDVMDLHDESTAEIEENIARIDETNRRVRAKS